MKILYRPRQTGKSTEAVRLAAKTGAYIVCLNKERARSLSKMAENMGLDIRYPITFDEVNSWLFMRGNNMEHTRPTGLVKNMIIDDAEFMLQYIFKNNTIDMITMSNEDIPDGISPEMWVLANKLNNIDK